MASLLTASQDKAALEGTDAPEPSKATVKLAYADVEHGLAVASSISPALVHHIISELDSDKDGAVCGSEVYRLGELLGERWDETTATTVFREADTDGDGLISYEELYRWLVNHTQRNLGTKSGDDLGTESLRRHAPMTASLADVVGPARLALFHELDLGVGHRADVIEPGRRVGLASHLVSVHTILKEWGADDVVCAAGLFHSVYEVTGGDPDDPHRACDIQTDRPKLRQALGEATEKLIYLFQPAQRSPSVSPGGDGIWDAPLGSDFVLKGVLATQPERLDVPAALRGALVALFWANLLDQTVPPAGPEEELQAAAEKLLHSAHLMPLMPPGMVAWMKGLLATLAVRKPAFDELDWTKRRTGWLAPGGEPSFWAKRAARQAKTDEEKEQRLEELREATRRELATFRERYAEILAQC